MKVGDKLYRYFEKEHKFVGHEITSTYGDFWVVNRWHRVTKRNLQEGPARWYTLEEVESEIERHKHLQLKYDFLKAAIGPPVHCSICCKEEFSSRLFVRYKPSNKIMCDDCKPEFTRKIQEFRELGESGWGFMEEPEQKKSSWPKR